MSDQQRPDARRFAIYGDLSLYDQWRFRRSLRWISSDAVSLELLLNFEKKLKENSLSTWQILGFILNVLKWYNREVHDDRLKDRLQSNRLPELLQIVLAFVGRSQSLHYNYRGLLLNILRSGDNIELGHCGIAGLTPERFRLEVAESVANLSDRQAGWDRYHPYLERGGNWQLRHLANIAREIRDPLLFTQYRLEAAKAFSPRGWSREELGYLEKIASKVKDRESFSVIFGNVVPTIGLETTACLMAISTDLQEFEGFYHRVITQLERWGTQYTFLFRHAKAASELDRQLVVLETLPGSARMMRYVLYAQTHQSGTLLRFISGSLLAQKGYVFQTCLQLDWTREPEIGHLVESQIEQFEQTIVGTYLTNIWWSLFESPKIRWEFDTFTEYIPHAMKSWDWTKDDPKARPYWNSNEAKRREYDRFIRELEPRLLALLRKLDLSAIETLFDLLPDHLRIDEFTKTVSVPSEWEMGTEYQDGYNKWAGNYTEEIEVARPIRFMKHDFEFERPFLQNAMDFLDGVKKTHGVI